MFHDPQHPFQNVLILLQSEKGEKREGEKSGHWDCQLREEGFVMMHVTLTWSSRIPGWKKSHC